MDCGYSPVHMHGLNFLLAGPQHELGALPVHELLELPVHKRELGSLPLYSMNWAYYLSITCPLHTMNWGHYLSTA